MKKKITGIETLWLWFKGIGIGICGTLAILCLMLNKWSVDRIDSLFFQMYFFVFSFMCLYILNKSEKK